MKLSIAIPNSSLSDETTQLAKSRKISMIARACAFSRVNEIYIYNDKGNSNDSKLLITLLKYLETPQFFRRYLYPKMNLLKYAGVLQPLQIPSHTALSNQKQIKSGDIREGLVVSNKGKKFLNIGTSQLLNYYGKENPGKRITIQFKEGFPNLSFKEIPKILIKEYWGYNVKESGNLLSLLKTWKGEIILTSRKGKDFSKNHFLRYSNSSSPILIVFGSPERGLHDILGSLKNLDNSQILNFFPNQATETIRLEEAIIGILSILNLLGAKHF